MQEEDKDTVTTKEMGGSLGETEEVSTGQRDMDEDVNTTSNVAAFDASNFASATILGSPYQGPNHLAH